ncbi:MAG: hypothetical protein Q9216_000745 [Gyalolechia sp. 2 TL-2023]
MGHIRHVPSAPTAALESGISTAVGSQSPSVDYQMLLLALAEDYLIAAHTGGSYRAMRERGIDMKRYHKLVATALGCLETLLNNFKLQPQLEANVRLRYASVLLDETENMMEAEQSLSAGIKLCDRYRFFDLKYNMDHLLAQVLFKGSPRASMKFLDGVIKDVEAYQHTAWVYAFRFLKVSLSLKLSSHQDVLSAFAQLRSISALADQLGDKAILAIASTLEALVHLRESSSAESIEQAQRALALARSLQLDSTIGQMSQIVVLINIVDLSCSLQHFDPSQAVSKMQAMQASLESHNDTWHGDGSFLIPVKSQGASRAPNGNGIVRMGSKGSLSIMFSWTPWADIYALGYLFSSMAIAHRSTSDGLRSEHMLEEGMRYLDKNAIKTDCALEPVSQVASRNTWRQTLQCFFQLHLVFALCTRAAWTAGQELFRRLEDTAASMPSRPDLLDILIQYLDGVIHQGTGQLDNALSIFQRPCLSLPTKATTSSSPTHIDVAILSTFNSILIVRSPSHPSHHLLPSLLSSLEPHLPRINTNKPLLSAHNLILATSPHPTPTIVKTKQYLQFSLQAAKAASNNQLMCITLNFMSYKFFKGVVGEQAEKSARASENLARKGMDGLWKSVSAGVLGDTLEMAGRGEEAERIRNGGREIARGLPDGVVKWEEGESEGEMEEEEDVAIR